MTDPETFYIDTETDTFGTKAANGQGPTPGQAPDQVLDENTPLYPFQNELGQPVSAGEAAGGCL